MKRMELLEKRFHSKAFSTPYLSPLDDIRPRMQVICFLAFWELRHSLSKEGLGEIMVSRSEKNRG